MNRPCRPRTAKFSFASVRCPDDRSTIGDARAVRGKLREIGSHAAADLQHVLAGVPIELHRLRHPRRVRLVPIPLGLEKPLLGVRRRLDDVVRSGGIVVPLALDLILLASLRLR